MVQLTTKYITKNFNPLPISFTPEEMIDEVSQLADVGLLVENLGTDTIYDQLTDILFRLFYTDKPEHQKVWCTSVLAKRFLVRRANEDGVPTWIAGNREMKILINDIFVALSVYVVHNRHNYKIKKLIKLQKLMLKRKTQKQVFARIIPKLDCSAICVEKI